MGRFDSPGWVYLSPVSWLKKGPDIADNMFMMSILPILIAVIGLAVVIIVFMAIVGRGKDGASSRRRVRGRDSVLRSAAKRLSQNPRDPRALEEMGDIYFQEESWPDAMKTYESLVEMAGGNSGIDEFEVNLRYGIAALKLNMVNEAYRGLSTARTFRQDNFEVNYNLGYLEFQRKNYEKAIQLLDQARKQDPESPAVLRSLGHSLFRVKKAKDAMNYIRKAIDLAPDDKESLFILAECYYEANQAEQALRLFNHMRADPVMGPQACLLSGTINLEQHQADAAIQDFEIGLRHQNVKPDILVELRYKLARVYLDKNDIGRALPLLKLIQSETPQYKDVGMLIGKYQELNANRNLQIYLMAPSADFVALCRKIVMTYFPKAKTKITNIQVNKNEWADIQAEVDTPKWSDVIMFRFIRTQGSIGELIVRDFHSHLKEVKAGKGVCITVGSFTEEAKRYTEARLIDLIEKDRLSSILNTVDTKASAIAASQKR
ncbi:MAG: tetratricopeptide repeat protein [Treponema sp.]|jgi:tetratricopeptide (TPR) repeat protein|nr:tetratricopeptide repeat protein [Treponema sp.]